MKSVSYQLVALSHFRGLRGATVRYESYGHPDGHLENATLVASLRADRPAPGAVTRLLPATGRSTRRLADSGVDPPMLSSALAGQLQISIGGQDLHGAQAP